MNGINTINQEIIPKPLSHKKFNKIVNIIVTHALKKAVLYNPLNVSIIICVTEKITYINAGGHKFFKLILYIILI